MCTVHMYVCNHPKLGSQVTEPVGRSVSNQSIDWDALHFQSFYVCTVRTLIYICIPQCHDLSDEGYLRSHSPNLQRPFLLVVQRRYERLVDELHR